MRLIQLDLVFGLILGWVFIYISDYSHYYCGLEVFIYRLLFALPFLALRWTTLFDQGLFSAALRLQRPRLSLPVPAVVVNDRVNLDPLTWLFNSHPRQVGKL